MKTLRLAIDPADLDSDESRTSIDRAASILREGGLVAFPTETVYGLGANALSAGAAEKIFSAKQRPHWDPLIVHLPEIEMLSTVAAGERLNPCAKAWIEAFWPGPLTLLLPKAESLPEIVTAGRSLVGVRIPAHPVARALLRAARLPIAAPSANSFRRISPTLAAHVLEDLDGRIDAVLDSGETTHGLESTVVDASKYPALVYRPGVISLEQLRAVCGPVEQWSQPENPSGEYLRQLKPGSTIEDPESMPSPGLDLRHYAPRAHLLLIEGEPAAQPALFLRAIEEATFESAPLRSIGVMLPENFMQGALPELQGRAVTYRWGDWQDLPQLAHRLFAGLRYLDAAGVGLILCPMPAVDGIGAAIRDRLLKAARKS